MRSSILFVHRVIVIKLPMPLGAKLSLIDWNYVLNIYLPYYVHICTFNEFVRLVIKWGEWLETHITIACIGYSSNHLIYLVNLMPPGVYIQTYLVRSYISSRSGRTNGRSRWYLKFKYVLNGFVPQYWHHRGN
jgi:hypothetical protein